MCTFCNGQHIIISFVSIAFRNHKNVCLALGVSVFCSIQSGILNCLFSVAILDAILNISANFVMGQHVVIKFVSNACLDQKNRPMRSTWNSVLSAIQSDIFNVLFSAAIFDANLNISANNIFPDCSTSHNDSYTSLFFGENLLLLSQEEQLVWYFLLCRLTNITSATTAARIPMATIILLTWSSRRIIKIWYTLKLCQWLRSASVDRNQPST